MKSFTESAYSGIVKTFILGLFLITLFSCDKPALGPSSTGSIVGSVKDYNTGKNISNVNITTSPPTSSLVTDSNGKFILDNIASGNYTIAASKYGYTDNSVTVSVAYGSQTQADIFLKPTTTGTSSSDTFPLNVKIINWANRAITSDSVYVDVQYKVSNIGSTDLNNYNIYFKIYTPSTIFEHEEKGTTLATNQSSVTEFSQYIRKNSADSVNIDGTWTN